MPDKPICTHSELIARVVAIEAGLHSYKEFMEERDRRYRERAEAQDKAVASALATSKEAIGKAELATEKRLEGLNELRKMATDQAETFARADNVDQRLVGMGAKQEAIDGGLFARVAVLERQAAAAAARGAGIGATWVYIMGGGGLLVAVVSALAAIIMVLRVH